MLTKKEKVFEFTLPRGKAKLVVVSFLSLDLYGKAGGYSYVLSNPPDRKYFYRWDDYDNDLVKNTTNCYSIPV